MQDELDSANKAASEATTAANLAAFHSFGANKSMQIMAQQTGENIVAEQQATKAKEERKRRRSQLVFGGDDDFYRDKDASMDAKNSFGDADDEDEATIAQLRSVHYLVLENNKKDRAESQRINRVLTDLQAAVAVVEDRIASSLTAPPADATSGEPNLKVSAEQPPGMGSMQQLFKLRNRVEGHLEPQLAEAQDELSNLKSELRETNSSLRKVTEKLIGFADKREVNRKADKVDLEPIIAKLSETKRRSGDGGAATGMLPEIADRLHLAETLGAENRKAINEFKRLTAIIHETTKMEIQGLQSQTASFNGLKKELQDGIATANGVKGAFDSFSLCMDERILGMKKEFNQDRVRTDDLDEVDDRVKKVEKAILDNRTLFEGIAQLSTNNKDGGNASKSNSSALDVFADGFVKRVVLNLEDRMLLLERKCEPFVGKEKKNARERSQSPARSAQASWLSSNAPHGGTSAFPTPSPSPQGSSSTLPVPSPGPMMMTRPEDSVDEEIEWPGVEVGPPRQAVASRMGFDSVNENIGMPTVTVVRALHRQYVDVSAELDDLRKLVKGVSLQLPRAPPHRDLAEEPSPRRRPSRRIGATTEGFFHSGAVPPRSEQLEDADLQRQSSRLRATSSSPPTAFPAQASPSRTAVEKRASPAVTPRLPMVAGHDSRGIPVHASSLQASKSHWHSTGKWLNTKTKTDFQSAGGWHQSSFPVE